MFAGSSVSKLSNTEVSYAKLLSLLTLEKDTDLMGFPNVPQRKAALASSFAFGIFRGNFESESDDDYRARLEKFFRTKIKEWRDVLDEELEASRYDPELLEKLQGIAAKIFHQGKTLLLKDKLELLHCCSEKTGIAITRLEDFLVRTLRAPKLDKPVRIVRYQESGPIVFRGFSRPVLNPLHPLCYPSLLHHVRKEPDINSPKSAQSRNIRRVKSESDIGGDADLPLKLPRIRKEIAEKNARLLTELKAEKVALYSEKRGGNWEEKLVDGFKDIKDSEVLSAIAAKLEPLQSLTIITCLLNDRSEEWKLVYLLGSLKHEVFASLLHSFTPPELNAINLILKRSSGQSQEWFCGAFNTHRDGFINNCNRMKDKIDDLAAWFRQVNAWHLMSFRDLSVIEECKGEILLRIKGIQESLFPMIEGVVWGHETTNVLFREIIQEYRVLLTRLTETRNYEGRPGGCLFPIIYRNVFDDADVEDEQEAQEIFATWSICEQEDYKAVGLLGAITDEEFADIKKKENVFLLGRDNLAALGIRLISDWKKLRVFNRTMLTEFLGRENRPSLLKDRALKVVREKVGH